MEGRVSSPPATTEEGRTESFTHTCTHITTTLVQFQLTVILLIRTCFHRTLTLHECPMSYYMHSFPQYTMYIPAASGLCSEEPSYTYSINIHTCMPIFNTNTYAPIFIHTPPYSLCMYMYITLGNLSTSTVPQSVLMISGHGVVYHWLATASLSPATHLREGGSGPLVLSTRYALLHLSIAVIQWPHVLLVC